MAASRKISSHSKRQKVFIEGSGLKTTRYYRCEGCWGVNRHSKNCKTSTTGIYKKEIDNG